MASALRYKAIGIGIVLTILWVGSSAFAQYGGVTGKVLGEDGKPIVGYVIKIDRADPDHVKWGVQTKTSKKGDYTYIGIQDGQYRVTLMGPDNKAIYFEETVVKTGEQSEVNFDLAKIHKTQQKTAEENPEYQKAVEAQKENANLKQLFDQALQLNKDGKYTDAAEIFEKALPLAKDRNVAIITGQLAESWEKAGDVETDPDKRKEDYAKALDYYNKAGVLAPNDPTLHSSLGHLYASMGKSDEAQAEYQKAADLDPTHAASFYYNLGIILVNKGKMDDAALILKKSTDLDPNNASAWYWYGMALMGKATVRPDGSMAPAPGTIEAFQAYLKLDPNGKYAPEAQASIDALSSKADLEYKKTKKK